MNPTTWRLLETGFGDPAMNMALDEALLCELQPADPPILRFYDWSRPAISLGYSQKAEQLLDIPLCEKEKVPIVRRPTGGGIVFHGVDITYSVILPQKRRFNIQDTYQALQGYIVRGLSSLGITVSQYPNKESLSGYCFVSPNIGDIMVGERKLAGMAIRRIKQKILCQGYVYYDTAVSLAGLLKNKQVQKLLADKSIYLQALLNKTKHDVKQEIIKNWPASFNNSSLTPREEQTANNLQETKYSLASWNHKR